MLEIDRDLQIVKALLGLKREPVGVKFLFDAEQFDGSDAVRQKGKGTYCNMIRRAAAGEEIKADAEGFACLAGARALGIVPSDDFVDSGRHYARHGLYKSLCLSKSVQKDITFIDHKAYGVEIRPLSKFRESPDIVILVLNPYQAMRVVQAYTYNFGVHKEFRLGGNQAFCSECTATPYESCGINLSLLCSGTRAVARWEDDDLAVGMAFDKFSGVAEGLLKTLNAVEPDKKKKEIAQRGEEGSLDLDIEYGKNYYSGLYRS